MSFDFTGMSEAEVCEMMYPAQREAFEECLYGKGDILVSSEGGGFGKSFLIEALVHFTQKETVVTGTSGVAATLINGATAHSTMGLPLGIPVKSEMSKTSRRYKSLFKRGHNIKRIVVDEISKFGPETFDSLLQRKERARKSSKSKKLRLILSGDFTQTLNIVKRQDEKLLMELYGSTRLLDSKIFKNHKMKVFILDVNKRSRDPVLTSNLSKLRMGEDTENVLKYFNTRVVTPTEDALYITTLNSTVDRINKVKFDQNLNPSVYYYATQSGDFKSKDTLMQDILILKVGLRVMSLVNDPSGEDKFVNGSVGTVVSLMDNSIEVSFDNGNTVFVESTTQENKEYYTDELGELNVRVVGSFSQIGIKQASSVSVEKCQGLSLEAATIDFSEGAFAAGQVYTALSRLTSLEGLSLVTPLKPSDVIVDPTVKTFYKSLRDKDYDPLKDTDHLPDEYKKYKIRMIVAGGRDFEDFAYLTKSLDFMLKNHKPEDILIVSGTAKGADVLGEKYAQLRGIDIKRFPANWKDITTQPLNIKYNSYGAYNTLAGMVRNKQMGDFSSHLVAYWNGSSGTGQMVDYMKSLGKVVKVFKY